MNRVWSQNGMALLITLAVIALLTAAGLETGKRVRRSTDLFNCESRGLEAQEAAWAGIQLALLILEEDANRNLEDSVQEAWADPRQLALAIQALNMNLDEHTLTITDELGKIQINSLVSAFPGHQFNEAQREMWERLLNLLVSGDKSRDLRDPAAIISSLKDWLDSKDDDAVTGVSGAEAPYYLDLSPPIICANAPFDHLNEIFNVKGVDRGLLKLTRNSLSDEEDGTGFGDFAISDVLTVSGMNPLNMATLNKDAGYKFSGTININTAPLLVLMALLPPGMEDQAQELFDYRIHQEEEGSFSNTLDKGWYERVIDLSKNEKKKFDRLIRYSSFLFQTSCRAKTDGIERTITALIQRQKDRETGRWRCKIIGVQGDSP